jgi:PKD repeat protein
MRSVANQRYKPVAGLLGVLACLGCAAAPQSNDLQDRTGLPFPIDRIGSATTTTQLGPDTDFRNGGVTQGNSLLLDAQNGEHQYAAYRFNVSGSVPASIDLDLDPVMTFETYVALADFNLQRWVFTGPHADAQQLALDPVANVSSLGNIYLAIVVKPPIGTAGAGTAKIDQLVLHENKRPVLMLDRWPFSGTAPLTVDFDATGSTDPDGPEPNDYRWDLDGDGTPEYFSAAPATAQHTYDAPGDYTVTLQALDSEGADATITTTVTVTN